MSTSLFLLACGSEPRESQPPDFAKAFANLPLPPEPDFVSRSGSSDALQITFHSTSDVAQVAEYYRKALSRNNWRLVSNTKNPDGSVVLYAEQKGPPLWVRVSKSDRGGATVELTGAVIDPAKSLPAGTAPPARPGK
ncbi:MAG: hypothetical protein ACJ8BF_01960 [Gemmatimonadales bacterium]